MVSNNPELLAATMRSSPRWMDRDNEFTRILHAREVIFYCPNCDAMAYIGRLSFFNPAPWRKDVFCWRNPAINKPAIGHRRTENERS